MGSCTRRHFLLSTCFFQLITIIERQVFDFLGYMWAPILANFFHIIFVIFGFYGAYHFRAKYIVTYLVWSFIWIGWNAFLICFYLDVGILDKNSDILNLGTGSVSWFEVNGYGCQPTYSTNITSVDPYRPVRPERVDDCILEYPIIEIIHSGVQCILAGFGILVGSLLAYIFIDEDDRFDFMGGDAKSPQHTSVHPMYVSYSSIPTTTNATLLSNKRHHNNTINKKSLQHFHNINNKSNQNIINYDDSTAIADQKFTAYNFQNQHILRTIVHPSSSSISLNRYSLNRKNNSTSNSTTFLDTAAHTNTSSNEQTQTQTQNHTNGHSHLNHFLKNQNNSSINGNIHKRPDIKYTQISSEQLYSDDNLINNIDETTDDDLCLQNFNAVNSGNCTSTYVPFQNPVPSSFLINNNINNNNNNNNNIDNGNLELNTHNSNKLNPVRDNSQALIANHDNANSIRIGSINNINNNLNNNNNSNNFIRQYHRSGNPPYPDLSPEVTEKYAMPYQVVPKSPVMSRISVRRRQDRSQVANFCDQIRNTPPRYNDVAILDLSRSKSQDRLSSCNNSRGNTNQSSSRLSNGSNRSQKPRPRSYCNSNTSYNFIPINQHYQLKQQQHNQQYHQHQQPTPPPQTPAIDY